jgi:light-regulated signal transduction histidine kinase (bacteriophytochrome)
MDDMRARLQGFEAFSYLASHDLQAPLCSIKYLTRMLLDEYTADLLPQVEKGLKLIFGQTTQMERLIQDLLSFSSLSYQLIEKRPVVMADLVHAAMDDIHIEKAGRNVKINIGDLPTCHADPALLKQVLINLLTNALKYTRLQKSALIEVGCQPQTSEGEPIFFVKDNGVGFDVKYAKKIFDPFERLHSPNQYEGTGVGLAIVQRIIDRHGGRVWADAKVDSGATFFFTLGSP